MPDLRISLPLLCDALATAVVAVLTVQALRHWVGDRYLVPSGSMQPLLYGDPRHGDIVFVDKLATAGARRRHDLVVVSNPSEPGQQLVKRIAASGDDKEACWINIDDSGDIWLGSDAQHMSKETKDPLEARTMRVPWAQWRPGTSAPLLDLSALRDRAGAATLPPIEVSAATARGLFTDDARQARRREPGGRVLPNGFLGPAKAVDACYVDVTGARGRTGEDVGVKDVGMDLELDGATNDLLCSIDARHEVLTFHWRPSTGCVDLWRNGEDAERADLPPFPAGVRRIEFGLLDDRAFFIVDGRRDAMFLVARSSRWNESEPGAPRSYVHVAVLDQEPMPIRGVRVFHDVFAYREHTPGLPDQPGAWPRPVEPGTWFLLGDSAFDSRDSRQFGAIAQSSFLGRPWFVVGPWPRCRWLAP
ncbi:MAG TPA: S26 family signal peptidase [Planctomycetota bacterium]|nr:S26 family signal peptidase [Planctomycetota bacterium]